MGLRVSNSGLRYEGTGVGVVDEGRGEHRRAQALVRRQRLHLRGLHYLGLRLRVALRTRIPTRRRNQAWLPHAFRSFRFQFLTTWPNDTPFT